MKVDLRFPEDVEECRSRLAASFEGQVPSLPSRPFWRMSQAVAHGWPVPSSDDELSLFGGIDGDQLTVIGVGSAGTPFGTRAMTQDFVGHLLADGSGSRLVGTFQESPPRFFRLSWIGGLAVFFCLIAVSALEGNTTVPSLVLCEALIAGMILFGLVLFRLQGGIGDAFALRMIARIELAIDSNSGGADVLE